MWPGVFRPERLDVSSDEVYPRGYAPLPPAPMKANGLVDVSACPFFPREP